MTPSVSIRCDARRAARPSPPGSIVPAVDRRPSRSRATWSGVRTQPWSANGPAAGDAHDAADRRPRPRRPARSSSRSGAVYSRSNRPSASSLRVSAARGPSSRSPARTSRIGLPDCGATPSAGGGCDSRRQDRLVSGRRGSTSVGSGVAPALARAIGPPPSAHRPLGAPTRPGLAARPPAARLAPPASGSAAEAPRRRPAAPAQRPRLGRPRRVVRVEERRIRLVRIVARIAARAAKIRIATEVIVSASLSNPAWVVASVRASMGVAGAGHDELPAARPRSPDGRSVRRCRSAAPSQHFARPSNGTSVVRPSSRSSKPRATR